MIINDLLIKEKDNNKIAIEQGGMGITYSHWYSCSNKISQTILSAISVETKTISVFLPNSINYAIAYFAVQFSKKILVPIGTQAKKPEILSTLEYCEIDIIITDSMHIKFILEILDNYKYKVIVYNLDSETLYGSTVNKAFIPKSSYLEQNDTEDDVAIMLHTSGTLSNPKRVMLTHKNLISNVESNIQSLKLTQHDKVLIALPMFFGYCNTAQFLTHIYLGASIVILESIFLPKQFFEIVSEKRITNFTSVPSMLLMLIDYRYSNKYDYSSLRYVCFGGGNMPVEKLKLLIQKYPNIGFVQTYGQTECSPRVTALLPEFSLTKIGSVGTPIPNVSINILNDEGFPLTNNQVGEIVVKGKNVMKGYYKQPEITNQTIRNGWIHTGDLGYIDDDGFLYLTGRIKNIIISGGINVYPEEIEQILLQHKNILDACVIGEEHKLLGEVPIVKVVLKSLMDLIELKQYCLDRLADYKVPVRFEIVDKLPKTYNGKTKRY